MSAEEPYDVIVVGAGPVGSTAANLAAAHGLRCLLVDQSTEVFPLPRAIHFDADIMRIFQFAGLAQRIEPLTRATTGGVHLGMDGEPIREFRVPGAPGDLGWRPHYMFFQPELDGLLRAAAQEHPLVDARLGVTCDRVTDLGDEVAVILRRGDGTTTEAVGRFVIAADGASSTVRQQLGLELTDYGFEEPWIIVDGEVADDDLGPDYTMMYCDPARPATYVPGPGRHRRWEFMVLPGEDGTALSTPESVRSLIAPVTPWLDASQLQIGRVAVYRFHALVASRWSAGRVFLAGDAAHQTPPFYGQGMCHGIRDVRNLLWKIAAVRQGRLPDELLETYQVEREPHVRAIIEAAVENGRYICTLDPQVAARRDGELRARMGQGGDVRSFREVIPGLTTGLIERADPSDASGLLFVQPTVTAAGDDLPRQFDELLGTGFALVTREPLDPGVNTEFLCGPLAGRVVEVAESVTDDGTLNEWFAAFGCVVAIVRPDRYVFGTAGSAAEIPFLLQRLEHALEPTSMNTEVSA
jgi:3-(3-hydroxy-phenyl)propionate hydroxylase